MELKNFLLGTALFAAMQGATAGAFDGGNKVAAYWNSAKHSLTEVCDNPNVDIVILSFVDKINKGDPSANFGGTPKGEDIKHCQQKKKSVIVSIGGDQYQGPGWEKPEQAAQQAQKVWDKYGGGKKGASAFNGVPTNGFDLDIEKNAKNLEAFVRKLWELKKGAKDFYLTAAPQCVKDMKSPMSDKDLHQVINKNQHWFDALFVQFYNNKECGLAAAYKRSEGPASRRTLHARNLNLLNWLGLGGGDGPQPTGKPGKPTPTGAPAATPSGSGGGNGAGPKIFFGTPGSPQGVSKPHMGYAKPQQILDAINPAKKSPNFGGVSVWTATHALDNKEDPGFLGKIKDGLK